MAEVTLFNIPPSLCSQRVRLALTEKGVDFTNRWVDIGPTAENYEPWYVKLNPKCVVPTLTHGDKVVTDSSVIMRYAAEQFEGTELLPQAPEARERMEHWYALGDSLDFRLFTFANANPKLIKFGLGKKIKKLRKYAEKYPALRAEYEAKLVDIQGLQTNATDPETVEQAQQRLDVALDELNGILGTQPFIVGDQYTLADVMWTVSMTRIEFIKRFDLIEARPHLLDYYRRMQARPSYQSADLWPRFNVRSMMPIFVKVLGPRLAIAALVLAGVSALVWWFGQA